MTGSTRYGKHGDPLKDVIYEWALEYVDEHGDIIDLDHGDTLDDVLASYTGFNPEKEAPAVRVDLALQRRGGNDDEGELERGYAYVRDGELEAEFDCGHKVPKRYREQIQKRV